MESIFCNLLVYMYLRTSQELRFKLVKENWRLKQLHQVFQLSVSGIGFLLLMFAALLHERQCIF